MNNNIISTLKKHVRMAQVPSVHKISRTDFYNKYVKPGKAVVIRGETEGWNALNWDSDYFKQHANSTKLSIKTGDVSKGKRKSVYLGDYVDALNQYEEDLKMNRNPTKPGYLHDVPFFNLFPNLVEDIEPFPVHLFPKWYKKDWYNYIQFFMGSTGSLTPLHFDTLMTNNLFFQVQGKKKFILIPENEKDNCYIDGWRWAKYNPADPDFEKFPMAKNVQAMEVILEPGDILFMPSGMLHQVHGVSYSISFNIDWHTPETARKGMMTYFKGAPKQNVYYNFLAFMGLNFKVPSKYIFPYYKSYLNYVS